MKTLVHDQFQALPLGPFPSEYTAVGEYHYEKEKGRLGNWYESTNWHGWRKKVASAWMIVEDEGRHQMLQVLENDEQDKALRLARMLVTGEDEWTDYTVTVSCRALKSSGFIGIALRYISSRKHYRIGFADSNRIELWKIDHDVQTLLATESFEYTTRNWYTLAVRVQKHTLQVCINEKEIIQCKDSSYIHGRVALVSTCPCLYESIAVTAGEAAYTIALQTRSKNEKELRGLREHYPQPVLWKTINTSGFGSYRQLRFGHLTGDDSLQMLLAQNAKLLPGSDSYATIGALTALDLDGTILWQFGEPVSRRESGMITCDLGFQIADIDGDGRAEVLCQKNFKLYVLEGSSGEVKQVFDLPENPALENQFGRLNGDGMVIANFRGLSQPMDIVVKNRYQQVWAFDNQFNLLWTHQGNTGHFPVPYDFDGDGRDALFVGYTLLDHDGRILWTYDWPDHTDEIVIGAFDPSRNDLQIATVSGDEGFNIFSQEGGVLHREYLGHAQRISVAKYRADLEGLQFYIKTYWGNPDILSLHDCRGNKLFELEPTHKGNLLSPVNWTGDGIELALLNGHPYDGGLIDGFGRKVVMFPDDGHPDTCAEVLDLDGDGRDEIVLWDRDRIWIYTQDRPFEGKRLYEPIRWPHWNNSNYRGEISLPRWKT